MIIPEEIIEKYLLGNASFSEKIQVEMAAKVDPAIEERLLVAERFTKISQARDLETPPMERKAASSADGRCVISCERYIVEQKYPDRERTLFTDAKEEHAFCEGLTEKGTALHNIGRIMEENGLSTSRHYNATLKDLKEALARQDGVIVVLNEEMLSGKEGDGKPNHAVCVQSVGETTICLYNPSTNNEDDVYQLMDFLQAWETSDRFAVFANTRQDMVYNPRPSTMFEDIDLNEDLEEVGDAIAEYVHDVWSERRIREGYIYGPETNTDLSKGPLTNKHLKPFSELSEEEKDLDREMYIGALKLVRYLGFSLDKYSEDDCRCPQCGKRIKMEWSYCCNCGRELQLTDFRKAKKD